MEEGKTRKRPVWAWLTVGGGITLIALVGVTVVALSQRPVAGTSSDRQVLADAPPATLDEQLAVTPPPPPRVPPQTEQTEDASPPTMAPPPDDESPSPGPPIWPPTQPPSDLKGAGIGVPGPQQAIRPEPRVAPRRPAPAPAPPRPTGGGRDG